MNLKGLRETDESEKKPEKRPAQFQLRPAQFQLRMGLTLM